MLRTFLALLYCPLICSLSFSISLLFECIGGTVITDWPSWSSPPLALALYGFIIACVLCSIVEGRFCGRIDVCFLFGVLLWAIRKIWPRFFYSMSSCLSSSASNFYIFICLGSEPSFLGLLFGGIDNLTELFFKGVAYCLLLVRLFVLRGELLCIDEFLLLDNSCWASMRVIF